MVPEVKVFCRYRVDGKRVCPRVDDGNGKIERREGTYYLRYDLDGKQTWIPKFVDGQGNQTHRRLDFTSVPAAKLNLERHLKRVAAAVEHNLPVPVLTSGHGIILALEAYLAERRSKGESDSGMGERRYDIMSFVRHSGLTQLEEVKRPDLIAWRDALLKTVPKNKTEVYSTTSVYHMMMTVVTFLKKNPSLSVTKLLEADDWPERVEDDPAPYSEEDFGRLLTVASRYEGLVLRFTVGTGCRNGEVMHLEKADIDFKRGTVWIHPKTLIVKGKRGMKTVKWRPKTDAGTRHIPISDALLKEFAAMPEGLIFPGPLGGLNHHFLDMVQELAEKAKLDREESTFHHLRDTFATAQVRLCKDMQELLTLAMRLGHSDLKTLDRYVKYVDAESKQARAAANAMDSYGKLGPQLVAAKSA